MIGFAARQLRRLVALVALAAMLIGAPYALYKLGLPLLPDHVPGLSEIWQRLTERDTGQVFLGFLVIVGAVAWAIFAITVLIEIASRLAHRPDWHLPGLHLPQAAAGALIGMIIAGTITTSAAPAIAASLPLLPHPAAAVATVSAPFPATQSAARYGSAGMTTHLAAPTHNARPAAATGPTWTVSKGDSLWSIAEQTLGSGRRYGEIAALNQGHTQPDGRTLESANFLLPGWILHLPADAHLPVGTGGMSVPGNSAADETVVVEPGDTLSQIALDELGDASLYPQLAAANHIANPDLIYPGQTIRIPATASPGRPGPSGPSGSSAVPNESTTGPRHGDDAAAAATDAATGAGTANTTDGAVGPANAVPDHTSAATDGGQGPGENSGAPTASAKATDDAVPSTVVAPATNSGLNIDKGVSVDDADAANIAEAAPAADRIPWTLGGVTALAAATAWAGLLLARRRLARRRNPGERPAPATAEESRTERSLCERAAGTDIRRLNAALRSVTPALAEQAPTGLDLIVIGDDTIELRPTTPAAPPLPFTGTDDAWLLALHHVAGARDDDSLAALPLLVTLGTLADGRIIAVDLEHLGALGLTGDPDRRRQLINHIVLELSQVPWTDGIHVEWQGATDGIAALDSDRMENVDNLAAATRFIEYQAAHTREILGGRPITEARTDSTYADAWEPHLLIAQSGELAQIPGIAGLIASLEGGPAAAAAMIVIGDDVPTRTTVTVDRDGTLHMPGVTEGVAAAGITDAELATVMRLFSPTFTADDPDSAEAAADPHNVGSPGEAAQPTEESNPVRAQAISFAGSQTAEHLDDDDAAALDADLREWFADAPVRPRIAILGPAHVEGLGRCDRPVARMTEYAVYLALHPAGVTVDKFVTDLWPEDHQPSDSTRRAELSHLRTWLDGQERGEPFLPTLPGRYQLTDRLLDTELFGRLRGRAAQRALRGDMHAAIADYVAALDLVRGPILPEAGGSNYLWLSNPDRMDDRILPMQVVDTAHSLVEIALPIGAFDEANTAAATGRIVDPYGNVPLCDLVRIALAHDDRDAARTWADVMLTVNEVITPADLPESCADLVAPLYVRQDRRAPVRAAT